MRRIRNLAILVLALSVPAVARGESLPVDDLGASYISGFFQTTVDTAVGADSEAQAITDVTPLLERHISFGETARFVLGRYWPANNPTAADEFQAAFRSFVIEAFTRGVRAHPGLALDVSRGKQRTDGTLLVPSELRLPTGVTVPLDWSLRKASSGNGLRIIDVSVAGIDGRLMLRNIAAATLAEGAGNLGTLIGLFQRSIGPAVAAESGTGAQATDP
jgi:ABC-type transporter MlaC component